MFITHPTGRVEEVSDNNLIDGKLHVNFVREGCRISTHEEIIKYFPEYKPAEPKKRIAKKTEKKEDIPKED
jgi:hypothetical protein